VIQKQVWNCLGVPQPNKAKLQPNNNGANLMKLENQSLTVQHSPLWLLAGGYSTMQPKLYFCDFKCLWIVVT